MSPHSPNRAALGIALLIAGVFAISINDMLFKQLSGGYPLHEIIFIRSAVALLVLLLVVQMEGGFGILKTNRPWLHVFRGLMIIIANMSFFLALAALPLADATALFFVAPLFITLLSIPLLGEKVGIRRIGAVAIGFLGVIIMQQPWADRASLPASRLVLLLPVLAALTYALTQLMTRKLGVTSKASALSVYIQTAFLAVSVLFGLMVGDGRFADMQEDPALRFLFRAWVWPSFDDWWVMIGMGFNAGFIGYCLSQAYRTADAATLAPFEYVGLPLAVMWGWWVFREVPSWEVWVGMALILGSGLFVFLRERQKSGRVSRILPKQ